MKTPVTSGHGELVLGAPDEPIRRQRQTVGHLGNIDDATAETFGEIQAIRNSVGDVRWWARSCGIALWTIAVILLVDVIRHW